MEAALEKKYNFDVVRWFTIMAVVYLVVGAWWGSISRRSWPGRT
jgi:cytochrome c oxidase cbb3-type subunit 1